MVVHIEEIEDVFHRVVHHEELVLEERGQFGQFGGLTASPVTGEEYLLGPPGVSQQQSQFLQRSQGPFHEIVL